MALPGLANPGVKRAPRICRGRPQKVYSDAHAASIGIDKARNAITPCPYLFPRPSLAEPRMAENLPRRTRASRRALSSEAALAKPLANGGARRKVLPSVMRPHPFELHTIE